MVKNLLPGIPDTVESLSPVWTAISPVPESVRARQRIACYSRKKIQEGRNPQEEKARYEDYARFHRLQNSTVSKRRTHSITDANRAGGCTA